MRIRIWSAIPVIASTSRNVPIPSFSLPRYALSCCSESNSATRINGYAEEVSYRTIIFDLGKVLVHFDFKRGYQALEGLCPYTAAEIPKRLAGTGLVERFETGLVEPRDFVDQFSRILDLNDTQTGVLTLVFKIADDQGRSTNLELYTPDLCGGGFRRSQLRLAWEIASIFWAPCPTPMCSPGRAKPQC